MVDYLKLVKETDSNKHLVDLCPENYSVKGATYQISTRPDMTDSVGNLIVNDDGSSNTLYLNPGTYYAKELFLLMGIALMQMYIV